METEVEAKFYPAPKDLRERLKKLGAKLVTPERLMRRVIFDKRQNPQISSHYIRVRDEGNVITMSSKVHALQGGEVGDQKEAVITVSDFAKAVEILESSGLKKNGCQETKRETWELDKAEIAID